MKKLMLFVLLIVACPSVAYCQAFGVLMGDPVSKYRGVLAGDKTDPTYFRIIVPQPNGEFETYTATATAETGICRVTGLGRTHDGDSYGTSASAAFDRLRASLDTRYGRSEVYDFLKDGALWTEPREWGWSIYKNERTLTAFWTEEYHSTLPASLFGIMLDMRATGPDEPYVVLTYEFANVARCRAHQQSVEERGL